MSPAYIYRAELVRVVDGDTAVLRVDVGFYLSTQQSFRLARIDTPEVIGPDREKAIEAKQILEQLIKGKPLLLQSVKTDKFGRWLADITVEGVNVSDYLMEHGYAVPYQGGRK